MKKQKRQKVNKPMDFSFLIIVLVLLAFGLIMVFSASTADSLNKYNDSLYVIKRQLVWAIIGIVAMFLFSKMDYHKLQKYTFPAFIGTVILLIAVLIVGVKINGAQRWLGYGSMTIQPSEVAKITMIIFLANALSRNTKILETFKGFMTMLGIIGFIGGLVI
ncbi:MAG: FtsW/RodA/SpoVE family cell cycle protein, partial [Hyphomonadaceae bacterium]|nr:FtsW/RodA/SpoVE family cell cycle protein [Clostridia bacterium]